MANSIFRNIVSDAGRAAAAQKLAEIGVASSYPIPFNVTGSFNDPVTHWGCSVVTTEPQTADWLLAEPDLVDHNYARCRSTGRASTQILLATDVPSLQSAVDSEAVSINRLAFELGLLPVSSPPPGP